MPANSLPSETIIAPVSVARSGPSQPLKLSPNRTSEKGGASAADYRLFVQTLAPFAPHLAEELWGQLGGEGSVHAAPWPQHDTALLVEATAKIAVQVDGKVRATLDLARGVGEEAACAAAEADPNVAKWLSNRKVKKAILVPDRLLSLVTEPSP